MSRKNSNGASTTLALQTIPTLRDTGDRVRFLMTAMSEGRYSATAREAIAAVWDITPHRVSELAGEASRALRVPPEELDALREQHAVWAEKIRTEAFEARSDVTGLRDLKAALEANRDAARFRGIDVDKPLVEINVEQSVEHGAEDIKQTLLDRLARIAAATGSMPGHRASMALLNADELPCPTCTNCPTCHGDGFVKDPSGADSMPLPELPPHHHQ